MCRHAAICEGGPRVPSSQLSEAKEARKFAAVASGSHSVEAVTLRITEWKSARGTTVRVEGRLDAGGVAELDDICRAAPRPIRLDLTSLLQADDAALELLRVLADAGATIGGASPYVRFLIENRGPGRTDREPPAGSKEEA